MRIGKYKHVFQESLIFEIQSVKRTTLKLFQQIVHTFIDNKKRK